MLIYKEKTSQEIIHKLSSLKTAVRIITIPWSIIFFVILFYWIGSKDAKGTAQIMGIIGLVVGFYLGKFLSDLYTVFFNWLTQMIIAIDNIIHLSKNNK